MSGIGGNFEENLDAIDQKILQVVSRDARITVTELSDQVGLSKTPCHTRLRRLEKDGYILGYRALLDPVKLGLDHIAFVEVKLSDTRAAALKKFNVAVRQLPQVEQCHMIAGGFDYLLKVRTHDITAYRNLLGEVLSVLPHVSQTSTYVVMEAVKDSSVLE
ncbi:MAG: winged helix-turn-helix transcriptional regulator [Rhizobiaceae bacterium]|nr:winged helix-turn-helix transcriptional regulator [Rhizobiaceae bacterium]